jgi:peptidoglycan glycosyltransferase
VNTQLRHLAVFACLLIAVLIGATVYWQSWAGGELANRQGNAVQLVAQLQVNRGSILAANGERLAWSVPHKKGGMTTYSRRYTPNPAFAQVVTGLDQSLSGYLSGTNTNLTNTLQQEIDRLGGKTVRGNNVTTTLKPTTQTLAEHLLAGRCGAVIAMNPKTGEIYAMASSPTFNPNVLLRPGGQAKVARINGTGLCRPGAAELNRTTQGLYPPGSTFKMLTASAALDTGKVTPFTRFYDPGYCTEYNGQKVSNSGSPDSPGGVEVFGNVNFAQAFEHSINSVFCNVGKELGARKILEYARRYGFYSSPPLETPPGTVYPSGLYRTRRNGSRYLWYPKAPSTQVDVGRLAFGQDKMLVTPLQLALVASTIADHGREPVPYLVKKVTAPGGAVINRTRPSTLGHPIKAKTAAELNQMMQLVVQGGTAASVGFPPSLHVAGKTGTAELNLGNIYDSWFSAFAPANNPQVAVAVIVEKQPNGFGATYAAPIAKAIIENVLHR